MKTDKAKMPKAGTKLSDAMMERERSFSLQEMAFIESCMKAYACEVLDYAAERATATADNDFGLIRVDKSSIAARLLNPQREQETSTKELEQVKGDETIDKEYNYTVSEFKKLIDSDNLKYFNDGDTINVFNSRTDKTETYIIENKKVATKISKEWDK